MDKTAMLIHRRNILILKIQWFFLIVDFSLNFFFNFSRSPKILLLSLSLIIVISMLVWKKKFIMQTMYLNSIFMFIFLFVLVEVHPTLINFLFIWMGLVLVSLYQNYRLILSFGILTIGLALYFYRFYHSQIFHSREEIDIIYLLVLNFFLTLVLSLASKFGEALRLNAERNGQEAIAAKQQVEQLLSELRSSSEAQIRHMAYHDELTGLPNRRMLNEIFAAEIEKTNKTDHSFAISFLDLDRFKLINDSLGHSTGDLLLKEVAQRLLKCVRQGDLVSRLGGDEFIILLLHAERFQITNIASQIINDLAKPFSVNERELYVTPSIGISICPADGEDMDALIQQADMAMYKVKECGGNNYHFFTPDMHSQTVDRLALEQDLRRAMERNELMLYYQAKIDSKTKRITGAEALVRWEHPRHGRLSPNTFIPIAEEMGLIIPLGEWVLRTAVAQIKVWQLNRCPALRLSVNLSVKQFQQSSLVDTIQQVLMENHLNPSDLELEITESILMQDVQQSIVTLQQLKELGLQISIDDFGTGYSSLSYLKQFPIHTLKIDRSFIVDLHDNPTSSAIAKAIISLGHGLGLKITAEGVENEAQFAFLREHECDEMQGYLFSPPISAKEFERLLRNT